MTIGREGCEMTTSEGGREKMGLMIRASSGWSGRMKCRGVWEVSEDMDVYVEGGGDVEEEEEVGAVLVVSAVEADGMWV